MTKDIIFTVFVLNEEVRKHISSLLGRNNHPSVGIANLEDLLKTLKERSNAIIFVDSEAVIAYGAGMVPKLRMACKECRLILLCRQAHRDLVKRVMELGAYGCIIEPYLEWEFATMVKPILMDLKSDKKEIPGGAKRRQWRKSPAD